MCELLGFSSRKRRRRNDLLREFYSHAEAHPHGWGLARFLDGGAPSIEKEPVCATCSTSLERLLADPVEERTLIAHIRLATVGHIEYKNCHPFTAADNIGTWAPVPFTSLVSAKDGEIVRTSPPHGHEYIYNPEDYRLVYMNFARL